MKKPSKIEAIRFYEFSRRHFGSGLSNRNGDTTFYLYDDDNKYKKIYNSFFDRDSKKDDKRLLTIFGVFKLFKLVEKNFGKYPNPVYLKPDSGYDNDELITKFLFPKMPK